jgi:hypothetical protein
MTTLFDRDAHRAGLTAALGTADITLDDVSPDLATQVIDWLANLVLLNGVPTQYLVPDVRMLPPESLRFFVLDDNWITCLLDGACSVGRGAPGSAAAEPALMAALHTQVRQAARRIRARRLGRDTAAVSDDPSTSVSGFVMRSQAVSAFPTMQIGATTSGSTPAALPILRLEALAPDILFCLFDGLVGTVTFSEPSEGLNFGFDSVNAPHQDNASFSKCLRNLQAGRDCGSQTGQPSYASAAGDWRNAAAGVVNISSLVSGLAGKAGLTVGLQFNAAQFGLEMIAGGQFVPVTISAPVLSGV